MDKAKARAYRAIVMVKCNVINRGSIMSSEKLRYLRRGPSAPLGRNQLKPCLKDFSHERLIEIVWLSAESNAVLWKALSSSIAIQKANGDLTKIKQAIDFAFYFPDVVPYSERGHGIIINEMINALETLCQKNGASFALQVAAYIYEEGEKILECFQEDWSWVCALENLASWIKNNSR